MASVVKREVSFPFTEALGDEPGFQSSFEQEQDGGCPDAWGNLEPPQPCRIKLARQMLWEAGSPSSNQAQCCVIIQFASCFLHGSPSHAGLSISLRCLCYSKKHPEAKLKLYSGATSYQWHENPKTNKVEATLSELQRGVSTNIY